nr:reverse transcriptase domain-containing protein [Tanacetum cinerariifolium]
TLTSQRVDLLMEDRIAHQETILIVEDEAYAARKTWAHSIRLSQAVHFELQTHREQAEIVKLQETNRRHQAQMVETFQVMRDIRREICDMQIEKMESVFQISGCAIENQVKFATCTLLDAALTCWNSHVRSLGPDAYSMAWEVLKKKMTNKYCPQGEIKKLEIKLWNLKVKGNDVPAYTERFQELTLICTKFFANKTKKIDKYIGGLPDNIYGSVKASKPKTLDKTIELANDRDNRENLKGNGSFKCGAPGHFKRDCSKLKNKYGGNVNAHEWVYVVGNAEKKGNASNDPDSNVVTVP